MLIRSVAWLSRFALLIAFSASATAAETIADIPVNPISLSGLRELAETASNGFAPEFVRPPIEGIERRVVSFVVDGLKQYALILQPAGAAPPEGWPVLLMNHGHHPNPPQYARSANGETDRPGDYYRALPLAFAQRGFIVVVPDFRGHNDSEGLAFARGPLESNWYSRDSIAAYRALDSLPGASRTNRFMWGHSMGGAVTLRALLALGNDVKGASIWSSTNTDSWKGAIYYSLMNSGSSDSLSAEKPAVTTLIAAINSLPFKFESTQADACRYLGELETPLNIHHSALEQNGTPYHWSVELAGALFSLEKPYFFYSYSGDHHLFEGENLEQAINRDVIFFRNLIDTVPAGANDD